MVNLLIALLTFRKPILFFRPWPVGCVHAIRKGGLMYPLILIITIGQGN